MSELPTYHIANYIDKKRTINTEKKPIPRELDIPIIEKLPRELVKIAENVARISGTWNPIEIYTADEDSRMAEREKVFEAYDKGEEYNPVFKYSYAEGMDLRGSRLRLEGEMMKLRHFGEKKKRFWQRRGKKGGKLTLDRGTRLFRTALYYKIKDDLATCDLAEGIKTKDEDKIAAALHQKYPGTDQALMDLANAEYLRLVHQGSDDEDNAPTTEGGLLSKEQIEWLKKKELTPEEVAEAYKWILNQYGILRSAHNPRGFYVKVSSDVTSTDVRPKSAEGPTVYVPTDRSIPMTAYKLLSLAPHEIEGHARNDVNGEELFFLGGGRLKIDNEELYEGLGLRYEIDAKKKYFGIPDAAPRPYFTFAVKMAEDGASFFEIFKDQMDRRLRVHHKRTLTTAGEDLAQGVDEKKLNSIKRQAYLATYRVMRGHIDMSNKKKFAMAKDLGYLRGYQMDKQLRENGLGYLSEEGIFASGGLAMLAEMKVDEKSMPIPYRDITTNYLEEVLMPQMMKDIQSGHFIQAA